MECMFRARRSDRRARNRSIATSSDNTRATGLFDIHFNVRFVDNIHRHCESEHCTVRISSCFPKKVVISFGSLDIVNNQFGVKFEKNTSEYNKTRVEDEMFLAMIYRLFVCQTETFSKKRAKFSISRQIKVAEQTTSEKLFFPRDEGKIAENTFETTSSDLIRSCCSTI